MFFSTRLFVLCGGTRLFSCTAKRVIFRPKPRDFYTKFYFFLLEFDWTCQNVEKESGHPIAAGFGGLQVPKSPQPRGIAGEVKVLYLPLTSVNFGPWCLTRNQVVLTGSWVRIPPAPPSKNPVTKGFSLKGTKIDQWVKAGTG